MSKSQVLSSAVQAAYETAVAAGSLDTFEFTNLDAMVTKFTKETWARIPAPHRRHMCYEDVEQEARMRVWKAIKTYDPTRGTQLSSWVYNTLKQRMCEVNAPFTDPTRCSGRVGIVCDIEDAEEIPAQHTHEDAEHALEAFNYAYQSGDEVTRQMYLDTLGFRLRVRLSNPNDRAVALDIANRFMLTRDDFRTLRTTSSERALLVAAKQSRRTSNAKLPQIECCRCGKAFPVTAAGETIDAKTLVCSNCYEHASQSDATCFAKQAHYDAAAPECSKWCPDRGVCGLIQQQGEFMTVHLVRDKSRQPNPPMVEDTIEDDDPFEPTGDDEETAPAPSKKNKPKGDKVPDLTIGSEQLELEQGTEIDGHDEDAADPDAEPFEDVDDDAPSEPEHDDDDDEDPFLSDDWEDEEPVKTKSATVKAVAQPSRQKAQAIVPITPANTAPKAVTKAKAAPDGTAKKTGVKAPVNKTVTLTTKSPAKSTSKAPAKAATKAPAKGVKVPVKATAGKSVKAVSKPAAKGTSSAVKPKRVLKEFKPQYWTGESPFRPGTAMQTIVDKLSAKSEVTDPETSKVKHIIKGVKVDKLKEYVDKQGLNWRGVRYNLAKGVSYNGQWLWTYWEDEKGVARLKITGRPDAEYRKACGLPVKPITTSKAHTPAAKKAAGKK